MIQTDELLFISNFWFYINLSLKDELFLLFLLILWCLKKQVEKIVLWLVVLFLFIKREFIIGLCINDSVIHLWPGDILGNLRVRTSDPWERVLPEKFFKFYFGLKHPKMTSREEGRG